MRIWCIKIGIVIIAHCSELFNIVWCIPTAMFNCAVKIYIVGNMTQWCSVEGQFSFMLISIYFCSCTHLNLDSNLCSQSQGWFILTIRLQLPLRFCLQYYRDDSRHSSGSRHGHRYAAKLTKTNNELDSYGMYYCQLHLYMIDLRNLIKE
jgi:hypothetical protein